MYKAVVFGPAVTVVVPVGFVGFVVSVVSVVVPGAVALVSIVVVKGRVGGFAFPCENLKD